MIATMIKVDNGFYIPKLDGYDDIKQDVIKVEIKLLEDKREDLSYKELKSIAIVEKYFDKLEDQIDEDFDVSKLQQSFRSKYNITKTLDEYLDEK